MHDSTLLWLALVGWLVAVGAIAIGIRNQHRLARLEFELEKRLGLDHLTSLLNRSAFLERAEQEVNRAQRAGHSLTTLLVDIDDMRSINAEFGNDGGDRVLRHLAGICRSAVRGCDLLGRFSSEEIAVLLPDTNREGACAVAERIRQRASQQALLLDDGRTLTIRVTIGLSELSSEAEDADDLLLAADGSLRRAIRQRMNPMAA
ncbi:GGDEF domain-containing protein [Chitinibacteraceae bacterium HSL-7]